MVKLSLVAPELEAVWASTNELLFSEVTLSSSRSASWLCPKGHTFERRIERYARGIRHCTLCSRRMLSDEHPELAKYWSDANDLSFSEVTVGSHYLAVWTCFKGHSFKKNVKTVKGRKEFSCAECFHIESLANLRPDLLKIFSPRNGFPLSHVDGSKDYSLWWSLPCGHEVKVKLSSLEKTGFDACYRCSPQSGKTLLEAYPSALDRWSPRNSANPTKVSSWTSEQFWWKCSQGHEVKKTIYSALVAKPACRLCKQGAVADYSIPVSYSEEHNTLPATAISSVSKERVFWLCSQGHLFKREVKDQIAMKRMCPQCSRFGGSVSTLEIAVREAIAERYEKLVLSPNYRNLPGVFEVDIYIEQLCLAIDVNGEYWHSDKFAKLNGWPSAAAKHESKILLCQKAQVRLAYIWEDDWRLHKDKVLDALDLLISTGVLSPILTRTVSHRDSA